MKRWFCLILAALLIVPVLPVGAAAAEIYEFEYMEPVALYADQFDFSLNDGDMFFCDSIIPPGSYVLHFQVTDSYGNYFTGVSEPFVLSFVSFSEDGVIFDLFHGDISACIDSKCSLVNIIVGTGHNLGGSLFQSDFLVGPESYFILERVDSFSTSGDIGLSSFLESIRSGLLEYSTSNLAIVIFAGLILACSLLLAWFGYRFLKRKVTKSVFKGRL